MYRSPLTYLSYVVSTYVLVGDFSCIIVVQPGATTRKSVMQVDRQNSEVPYYADEEDANRKKYSRRGLWKFFFSVILFFMFLL